MQKQTLQAITAVVLIAVILIVDQIIKINIKTTMTLHQCHEITSWFKLVFVENNGMAYGMSFIPKTLLSIFRMCAIVVLCGYLANRIIKGARWIFVVLLAMVIAGAAGNLIDCMFYGLTFTESTPWSIAQQVPFGEGYETFLHGRVVDMFYFPLIETTLPEWLPIWGGDEYIFFSPVFNFADASISVAVVSLILFCRTEMANITTK